MLKLLLDLLFPKTSLLGKPGAWITDKERELLQFKPLLLHTPELRMRGLKYLDRVIAAGRYASSPLLRRLIRRIKYGGIRELTQELGDRMHDALQALYVIDPAEPFPAVCPVPLHWTRRFSRGFNQSELLAKRVAREQNWQMNRLLVRIRPTGHQTRRNRQCRLHALSGAFVVTGNGKRLPGRVLLVDDIFTTGSTLEACAKALKESGVRHVDALVAASA